MPAPSARLRLGCALLVLLGALACSSHADDLLDGGAAGSGGTAGNGGTGGTGTGGTAGTGGIGTGGTAGTGGTSSTDAGDCGCVTRSVRWGSNGGRVAFTDTSALEICRTFSHERVPGATSPPTLSCMQELGACAGTVSAGDVARAVAQADVQAAIAAAPVVYGEDTRPVDGAVLRIQFGAAIIDVGQRCASTTCKPIPAGVDALATLLQSLTRQELGRASCKDTFGPG